MGRVYFDKKRTVETCKAIDINLLKRLGFIGGYRSGQLTWKDRQGNTIGGVQIEVSTHEHGGNLRIHYTQKDRYSGQGTRVDYGLNLVATACYFSGVRYWFVCPLSVGGVYCGRRVGKLYLPPGSQYFGCRHCHNLSYETRNESRLARPGGPGYALRLEQRFEKLYDSMSREFYAGRPTRKFRRLLEMERQWSA